MAHKYSMDTVYRFFSGTKSYFVGHSMELYKNRVDTQAAWKEITMILIPDFESSNGAV